MRDEKKSQDSNTNNNANKKKNAPTVGVADYFTILGVGDDLIWKHTQKQREQQEQQEQLLEQQQQQQQQQGEASDDAKQDTLQSQSQQQQQKLDTNQEDQAALMERYYREIIDVTIVTHQEQNHQHHHGSISSSHPNNPPSSVAQSSSIHINNDGMVASSPSYDTTDGNSSITHNHNITQSSMSSQIPGILPSPSSHSEATTVATTVLSASDTNTISTATCKPLLHSLLVPSSASPQLLQVLPVEMDGFTLLPKTHPPQRNTNSTATAGGNAQQQQNVWNNPSIGSHTHHTAASQQQQQQQNHDPSLLGNPLSSNSFSQPMDSANAATSNGYPQQSALLPWDQHIARPQYGQHHNNQQQQQEQADIDKKYTFDANLDVSGGGLREQVCSMVLQWEDSILEQNNNNNSHSRPPSHSGGASVGGSSTGGGGASLKGLQQKVKSSWKRWNHASDHHSAGHHHPNGGGGGSSRGRLGANHGSNSNNNNNNNNTTTKFYLGYKRRSPDQDHVPAIADVQLLYVRLPRDARTNLPSQQNRNHQQPLHHATTPVSPPGSSASLAGRAAAAAGNVLFRSHSEVGSTVSSSHANTNSNNHNDNDNDASQQSSRQPIEDFQKIDLEFTLKLPEGFDAWSIPETFRVVYLPKPKPQQQQQQQQAPVLDKPPNKANSRSRAADKLRQKTVLMASPSHDQRRRQRPNSPTHSSTHKDVDSLRPLSPVGSPAEEAVEAYVSASFSAPNSPNPLEDDDGSMDNELDVPTNTPSTFPQNDTVIPPAKPFVPELFTDVPWEEDHQETGQQLHHPYYHAEEQWWYIPVLAVRKQRTGDEERFHEDPGIVDVAVSFCDRAGMAVLPREEDDLFDDIMDDNEEEFSLLSKTSWLVGSDGDNTALLANGPNVGIVIGVGLKNKQQKKNMPKTVKKALGSPTILVKRNAPIGFADIAFATRVLDRFPLKNYKGLPLPEEELPMFCYPTGCRLHRAEFSDAPLPEYYGFVVKNERGDSIFVSCVSFFEPLTRLKIEQLSNMSEKRRRTSLAHRRYCERRQRRKMKENCHLYCSDDAEPVAASDFPDDDCDDDEGDNWILTGFDTMTTFENKTICLVSRYPFWTGFRRFLSHLHILSGSSSDLPLERYVSHLLLTVPVPRHGGPNVIVPLPALNQPMILSLPPLKDFPMVDLPYHRLVACLDIPTIVTLVLGFVALERKVIVMSTRPSLVLDACELLRSLLFPFDLCAPYVPRLTEPFMSCLEFPGAIFVGIHDDRCPDGLAAVVRKTPPEDSIIVDLDSGSIVCSGNRYEVLTGAWDIIPRNARSTLVSELETLCRDADIVPGQEPLDSLVDSAFDATLPSGLVEDFDMLPERHKSTEPLDDRGIRDAFLRFYCSVLRGYERFLVVPDADFLISGNEWFDTSEFLSSASKENVGYLNSFVSTQLFQSFIQRRTEDSDLRIAMFDECLAEYHAAPMPYGRLGGDVETVVSSDNSQPQMLYSLLVDQSASAPYSGLQTGGVPGGGTLLVDESNMRVMQSYEDDLSRDGGDSDFDTSSYSLGNPSISAVTDSSERVLPRGTMDSSDLQSIKNSESVVTSTGDIITAPPRTNLPPGIQFIYCIDGNPCFPHRLNKTLFLPREPESWLVEMSKTAPNPSLARSEREVEEANRRRKAAISYRGFQAQKRCLWQLPKLMGSHFLGAWIMCIPSQVSQQDLARDQQSRYLLRALGALRLLRHKQRIIPDEAAYRALMVACGRTTSDRRVELVKLFGLLRSDGIFPSAVTLGQYTKALAEGYSKRSATEVSDDNVHEFSGVEVTESMSMGGVRSSGNSGAGGDAESTLFTMDGNLTNLEIAGRKWRQRTSSASVDRATRSSGVVNGSSSAGRDLKVSDERHQRKRHRTWLPVVVSSSFLPNITNTLNKSSNNSGVLPKDSVRLVALWSRTSACDSCGYIALEEEVMAGWDAVGGSNDVLGSVSCPRCGSMIIPMLGYREMSVEEALELKEPSPQNIDDADFAGLPPQLGPYIDPGKNKVSFVTYISPATLRFSLERYIDEMGEGVLSRDRLKELDPEVFYNLFWYCARFDLPLPLPINRDNVTSAQHYIAFGAWERTASERGCYSGARAISGLLSLPPELDSAGQHSAVESGLIDPFDDFPLLGRYNLQGFHPAVWDHPDLSEILVSLVTVCDSDRRDFKLVVECVLRCNKRRREKFGDGCGDSGSDVNLPVDIHAATEGALSPSVELDPYKTILYLAKYQCTTAFHTFFPAVSKACKGYHFWCHQKNMPIFDRLLREAVARVNSKDNSFAPIPDVSDVALGFRCVFGHLI